MSDETVLDITVLSVSGRTTVPKLVRERLRLNLSVRNKDRLVWLERNGEIVVRKGASETKPTVL